MSIRRRGFLAGCSASLAGSLLPEYGRAALERPVQRVSIGDLGARPETGDATPFFAEALARLPHDGGAVLQIPPGTWRFAQTQGTVVSATGFKDLAIEGKNARLLFQGRARPFVFSGCQAPAVRGLTIDWERPPFSQGDIVSVGNAGRLADIRIDAEFPVDGSETVSALATYDREKRLMARGGIDAYDIVERVTLASAQLLRLAFKRSLPLRVGDTVVLRHAIYAASALSFVRSSDLLVEDVTIHSAPGMGVFADHCSGGSVTRLRIAPPAGSSRLMTTTADGVHFSACGGRIAIEDCEMGGMGDDCVNIHGKYFRIVQRLDTRTMVVAASSDRLAGPKHATPGGDRVEILAAGTLETRGRAVIAAAEPSGEFTTLHLAGDLGPDIQAGDYMFDAETRSRARVSRCRFPGNRARGVLAHSDAVIEGCTFSGQSAEAVLLLPDVRFMEGPAAERVQIRGNEIAGVLRLGGRQSGAVRIGATAADLAGEETRQPAPVNRDIAVIGNRIADIGGAAVLARSCTGLTIVGNRIERPAGPAIVLQDVQAVRITSNACTPVAPVAVGPRDRPAVNLEANSGLIEP